MENKIDLVLLTHNHVNYIKACLESIVQQTIFHQIRVILCEDASTDGTADVCIQYANQYPQIELHSHASNLGFSKNMVFGLKQVGAPFFALLDGDDYYTDPMKLERQLAFLQSDPDCVAVAHDVKYINRDGAEISPEVQHVSGELMEDEWTGYRPFHTNTFLAKTLMDLDLNKWEPYFLSSDQVIIHLLHQRGKVVVWPDRLSTYRKHDDGYSVKIDKVAITENLIALMKALNQHANFEYASGYCKSISRYYADLLRFKLRKGQFDFKALGLHYLYGIKGGRLNLKQIPWIIKNHYASN